MFLTERFKCTGEAPDVHDSEVRDQNVLDHKDACFRNGLSCMSC